MILTKRKEKEKKKKRQTPKGTNTESYYNTENSLKQQL